MFYFICTETHAKQPLQEEKRKFTMGSWKQGDEI
jgi:hypothetical protein